MYLISPLDWTKRCITLAIHRLDLLIIGDNTGCESFHEGVDEMKECNLTSRMQKANMKHAQLLSEYQW